MSNLGRRVPTDWLHVEKHGIRRYLPAAPPAKVETILHLPPLRAYMDQGNEGSCVGWAWSWAMSIFNQHRHAQQAYPRYMATWLYTQAQAIDEWADTPPEEGTSVRAGGDVLRTLGHERVYRGRVQPPALREGLEANAWATTVDEVRQCLASGRPAVFGINWYDNFDHEQQFKGGSPGGEWWIGTDGATRAGTDNLGSIRGGHAICCYAASDRRQAVKLVNSWGMSYHVVWLPYRVLERLLREDGEAALPVDRGDA